MRYDMPPWVVPTEFRVINPGQSSPFAIDPEKWQRRGYQDITTNVRELTLTCKPEVPIQQFAEVLALDGAEYAFRGYVERYKKTKKENIFYCKGIENLLWHRHCHKWNYAAVVNADSTHTYFKLGEVIKDHYNGVYPISYGNTDNCPGLLHVANSLMPWYMPFSWYDWAKKIVKYTDWGIKSRIGNISVLYYIDDAGVYPLTKRGALADLQTYDQSFYIDTNDLYIRNTTNTACTNCSAIDYWPYHGKILADNAFDTKLRIGDIDYDNDEIHGFLKLDHTDSIADHFFSVLKSFGLYPYLEDREDYTYIHAWTTMGQVPGPEGILHTIDEADKETITFEKSIPNKPLVHALRGYGDAEQIYTWANYSWKGLWYEDTYPVEHGYWDPDGILIYQTNTEFANRQNDYQYLIKTLRKLFARPGDLIRVVPKYDETEDLPINSIINSSDGTTTFELNYKTPKFTDAWRQAGQLSSPLSYYNMLEIYKAVSGSCDFHMRTSAFPACAFGSVVLHCYDMSVWPNPRVILNVSIPPHEWMDTDHFDPQRYFVMIAVNGNFNENTIIYNYAYGDSINDIDISSIVTYNADNTITIMMYYMGNVPGVTSCDNMTYFTATITLSHWMRTELWQ